MRYRSCVFGFDVVTPNQAARADWIGVWRVVSDQVRQMLWRRDKAFHYTARVDELSDDLVEIIDVRHRLQRAGQAWG